MAVLRDEIGARIVVESQHLLGRSRSAHTRLRDSEVSGQHCVLTWTVDGWVIRDLGSRNGTSVDGELLQPGEERRLSAGAVLLLGRERLVFASDTPPAPAAESGGRLIEGRGELLALPSEDDPIVVVVFDADLGWQVLRDDASHPATDGQVLVLGGEPWTLRLPVPTPRTAEVCSRALTMADVALQLQVSGDEEHVEVTATIGGVVHRLKPRTHHYLVLTLARARAAEADRPEREQGWLYSDELAKMLRITNNLLYVSTHRARKELEALGVADASDFIERRTSSRQLRLGVSRLDIRRL